MMSLSEWEAELKCSATGKPGELFRMLRYGVCQLATMGFFPLMKGSARNVCTFFNVQ